MMISSRTLLSFTFPPNQLGRMAALTIFNGSDRLNVPSQVARQPALRTDIACLHEPSSRHTSGVIGSRRASSDGPFRGDRKSTRLNSSHDQISYAVFCLKKKNKKRYKYTCSHISS